ncbi:MAG: glycosyltransferase family 9 protein [Bacteroidetes bacterium]|nr:glycosyltransferase family 9 protein [Bacteroidota bacterium]
MSRILPSLLKRNHKRILVVRPDRVGDVVLSTPVYHTLKESFPGCLVGALVSPYTSPLLKGNPYIDVIITDDPDQKSAGGDGFFRKVREIQSYHFDTALLLMPTKRTAYLLFLSGIPYRVGVGHILYEVLTFMHGVSRRKYNPLRHESEYMLDLAEKIGAVELWTKPEIFVADEEKAAARKFLEKKGLDTDKLIAGIHPGSGHSAPNWEVGRYSEFAKLLSASGIQVLVTGSDTEGALEKAFAQTGSRDVKTSFGELSLRELTAVISVMNVLVSSSTGPMHIASAVGTPTVSMFCPLTACSPKLWGPIGNLSEVILPPEDFCGSKCPGDPHICTFGGGNEGILVHSVLEAIKELFNKTESAYDNSAGNGQRC